MSVETMAERVEAIEECIASCERVAANWPPFGDGRAAIKACLDALRELIDPQPTVKPPRSRKIRR